MKTHKLFIILSLFFIFSITSCYDPVFYEIRKDVPPEPATFNCPINSIARYSVQGKEYLVTATNEGVSYKDATNAEHGSWKTFESLPFTQHYYDSFNNEHVGQQIIYITADSTTLYLITVQYEQDDSLGVTKVTTVLLWAIQPKLSEDGISWVECTPEDWKCLIQDSDNSYFPIYEDSEQYFSAFSILSTNAPLSEHRKVFIRRGKLDTDDYSTITYYEVSGLNEPVEVSEYTYIDSEEENCANSVMYFNDNLYFLNSSAVVTNESYSSSATRFYFSKDNDIFSNTADNSLETVNCVSAGNPVSSLAYCTDSLLIARANYSNTSTSSSEGGIFKVSIYDGNLDSSLSSFSTNAEFQLPSTYFIPVVLNATPDRAEKDSYLYASTIIFGADTSSSASYNNVGLWSYYPERGNWNRE